MRSVKRFMRQIALALAIALLVPMLTPAAKVHAADEVINSFTVEMGENAYLEYEETDSVRTAVYYKDGVAIQKSVYDLETGEILCYDLSQNIGNSQSRTVDMRQQNVVTYHIDDFRKTVDTSEVEIATSVASARGLDQNLVYEGGSNGGDSIDVFLMARTYTYEGIEYERELYGHTSYKEYMEDYWYFEAGITITVVATAVGFFCPEVLALCKDIISVSDALLTALSVTHWVRDYFWRYSFVQSTPTYIAFECPYDFTYARVRRLETSEGGKEWELFEQKTSAELDAEREEILERPVLYQ